MMAAILNCACHVGFRHCHFALRYLVIFSQIHSKHSSSSLTLSQTHSFLLQLDDGSHLEFWQCWIQPFCTKLWIKLVQSDSNSFFVSQLPDGSHLELCHLGFSHYLHKTLNQTSSICQTHLLVTELVDGSHFEFCHVGIRHCHLGFKHLVIFSQIHSKTLFLHCDPDSN